MTYAETREEQFVWARANFKRLVEKTEVALTPTQKIAVLDIMKEVASAALVGYGKKKEVKEFKVTRLHEGSKTLLGRQRHGTIVIFVKAGAVNDEGTIGRFTRPTQQFFIGRNGGITWNECRDKSRDDVRHYGRRNLYTAFSYSPFRMFV